MLSSNIRKKSFITLLLMLFMCIFSYKTVYAQSITKDLEVKTNISADHSWHVRFNRNVDKSTVNNKNIKVTDSSGEDIAVKLAADGKIVTVIPINDYRYGGTYDINVENVKSISGEDLSKKVHMKFKVEEDLSKQIKTINDINVTVNNGQAYILPSEVQAIFKDGSKKSVQVTWNSKSVDTSTVGSYTYEGRVSGYNKVVNLTLNIKAKPNKGVTICIDPGHGGSDPGATGVTGVKEKDVTLNVGLKLGKILKQRGINVVYTRTTDKRLAPTETTDLQERCNISNNAKAKYTISIHNNSFDKHSVNGTETYYFPGSSEGQKLAKAVQKHIIEDLGSNDRHARCDRPKLYVLKYTNSATILTELGFLSNPEEERKLNTDSYQNKYANAIAKGVFDVLDMNY